MAASDDEDDLLRSVALQNARSVHLARQRAEEELRQQTEWLRVTLASIGDAVISTDAEGRVTFLNGVAETLTGWNQADAIGRPLPEVFQIVNEQTREPAANPALRVLAEGTVVGLANHTVLIAKDGTERPIDDSAAPIRQGTAAPIGAVLVFRDVTERKRSEDALRASEARCRAIVEATPECVKLVGPDGTLLQMNPAGLAMIEADESVLGQCVYDVIAPEFQTAFRQFNEQVCQGQGGTLQFDIIGLRGTRRHMETRAVPLPVPEGGVTHLAVTRDITQRAAAERTLAANRARLDYAARASGLGFWSCDLPFRDLIWDARVKEHFWLPPDAEVTIDTFFDRIAPEDREPTRRAIEASIRDKVPYQVDYRTVNPATGEIKWIRALGGAAFGPDGTPIHFDGVTVDVTARKRDEEHLARLLERERIQARLLQKVADAALTIHSSGTLESVLQVVTEEARSVIGAHVALTSLVPNQDWSQAINTISMSHKYDRGREIYLPTSGEGVDAVVCGNNRPLRLTQAELEMHPAWQKHVDRRGGATPVRGWLAAPFVSRGGKNLGLVQLSDRYDGEFTESDEAILVQLAHIASVAIENARLYGELREQDRRKDEFLAILAHELRNPLAPLRNGLEVMRLSGTEDEEVALVRSMMDRQLAHMVRLIDDLLDISRIGRNKMELRRERVFLAEVITSAVELVQPAIDTARQTLTITLPPEPVQLDADLTRLSQVFGNLLSNSSKYTPHGGQIWLTAMRESSSIAITVRDTGIGIPAHALPNIFDMFSQVDRSIERSTGGMGIGLALVRGLVEMHGGSVEAISPGSGQGSTFTVRLPLLMDEPPLASAAQAEGQPSMTQSKQRILVVDDNRDSAASMALMLKLLGNEVCTAHDGLQAIATAEEYRPNLILMDVGMPNLNGFEATRRIREQPWGSDIVIIALTGWGQDTDRAQSHEAGCNGHLVKPVSLQQLEELLA